MAREATVVCGSYSVRWDLICSVAFSVVKRGYLGPFAVARLAPGIASAMMIYQLKMALSEQTEGWPMLELLRLTRRYMATDPRDKVFALTGIVLDPDSIGLELDYRLSTEEVYLSVAIDNLIKLKNMVLLANGGISSALQNPKLASWVPDWSHGNDRRIIIASSAQILNFCAAGDSQPAISISADKKVLTIRGAIIDSISQLNTYTLFTNEDLLDHGTKAGLAKIQLHIKAVDETLRATAEGAYKFPEGQTREESLWRTLCCDRTTDLSPTRAPAEFVGAYRALRKINEATGVNGDVDPAVWTSIDPADLQHFVAFGNTITRHCAGRHLCVTSGGYLGHVHDGTLIGDKICILFGSRVPFVLRECEGRFFKLVGECYVHGIMDGEAMKDRDIEPLSRDFEII